MSTTRAEVSSQMIGLPPTEACDAYLGFNRHC
jgi:hypothetical protein